jgi:ADP-ribosylglycohydrolase
MPKRPKHFSDESEMAKSILDEIIEETERPDFGESKSALISKARQQSGQKGGKTRASNLTKQQRSAIARKAANKRWANK